MSTLPRELGEDDLQRCFALLPAETWQQLAGRRIFMTGGTGFVGKWMLASLLHAERLLDLKCEVTVLTRNPESFQKEAPELADQVSLLRGDVRDFALPDRPFDTVVHAATDVVAHASPENTFLTCIEGTRRVLALARQCGTRDLLLVSSGAVYGSQPAALSHVPENYDGAPDPLTAASAYGEGKRVSEWLACATAPEGLKVRIARCFTFVGPHLPLDKHFAIGNFLGAVLAGRPIVIHGDGTPHRSYLYAADMAAWLWCVLLKGRRGVAYNVGAQDSISMADVARRVCHVLGVAPVIEVKKRSVAGAPVQRYVPDTTRARTELGLPDELPLDEAILRTAHWHYPALTPASAYLGPSDQPPALSSSPECGSIRSDGRVLSSEHSSWTSASS